jgi:K+/H+ antiporter YhaU regulatory subunit KhtT
MYARLVRFEGAEPSVLERELEQMRTQIQSGMSGEQVEVDDQSGSPNREQMETMHKLIKRVLVLADRDQGSSAMVVFTDTEGEIRQLDAMFNQMSPGEGGGQRQSVDIYEVAIDEQSS